MTETDNPFDFEMHSGPEVEIIARRSPLHSSAASEGEFDALMTKLRSDLDDTIANARAASIEVRSRPLFKRRR